MYPYGDEIFRNKMISNKINAEQIETVNIFEQ